MEVISHTSVPELPITFYKPPHGMWLLGTVADDANRFFAVRHLTPSFIIEVSDPHHLEIAAGEIVADFLNRMHRYGFRK